MLQAGKEKAWSFAEREEMGIYERHLSQKLALVCNNNKSNIRSFRVITRCKISKFE